MISSAYDTTLTGTVGVGRLAMKKLNNAGEILEPCDTPVWIILAVEVAPLKLVFDYLPCR